MNVVRIPARQGHPVPKTAYRAKGPFPQSLYEMNKTLDPGEVEAPPGATAQNSWTQVPTLICSYCGAHVPANQTEDHECA